jgi:putative colanic acid biosynthesis UDP-glucose lipid carrier transferase
MENNFYTRLQLLRKSGDYIIINLSFFIAYFLKFGSDFSIFTSNNYLSFLLFFNLAWVIATSILNTYSNSQANVSTLRTLDILFRVVFLHLLLVVAFNGVIKTYFSRLFILYSYISFVSLMLIWRYISLWILVKRAQLSGKVNKVLLIGVRIPVREIEDYFSFFLSRGLMQIEKIQLDIGSDEAYKKAIANIKAMDFSEVFLSVSNLGEKYILDIIDYSDENLKNVHLVIDEPYLNSRHLNFTRYGQTPVINLRLSPLDQLSNQVIKRVFDFIFSLFVLVFILSWLYPLIAILIKISSKGPVLFNQERTGLNNETFMCHKFRTMKVNELANEIQSGSNDPRVTKIGRFLRYSSIDELPQFFNVLKGEMSVVGPRPHMLKHTDQYRNVIGKFMLRHAIKPGITGLAQAKGYRGEIKNLKLLEGRVKYDRFYVENWSLSLDLKIIFMTIQTLFNKHL